MEKVKVELGGNMREIGNDFLTYTEDNYRNNGFWQFSSEDEDCYIMRQYSNGVSIVYLDNKEKNEIRLKWIESKRKNKGNAKMAMNHFIKAFHNRKIKLQSDPNYLDWFKKFGFLVSAEDLMDCDNFILPMVRKPDPQKPKKKGIFSFITGYSEDKTDVSE